MTIAEKIARAKTDYDEVYEAGYAKGQAEGGGYEEGIRAVWNSIQANGKRTNYGYAFQYWEGDEWFKPIHNMYPTSVAQMFYYAKITDLKGILEAQGVTIDFTKAANLYFLANTSTITRFPPIVAPLTIQANRAFINCPVVSIDLLGVSTTTACSFVQAFDGCTALEEIRFVAPFIPNNLNLQWSTKLSHDSLKSLIDALADKSEDTSGTVWSVTIGSTNYAKLTEEYIEKAQKKGWELQ